MSPEVGLTQREKKTVARQHCYPEIYEQSGIFLGHLITKIILSLSKIKKKSRTQARHFRTSARLFQSSRKFLTHAQNFQGGYSSSENIQVFKSLLPGKNAFISLWIDHVDFQVQIVLIWWTKDNLRVQETREELKLSVGHCSGQEEAVSQVVDTVCCAGLTCGHHHSLFCLERRFLVWSFRETGLGFCFQSVFNGFMFSGILPYATYLECCILLCHVTQNFNSVRYSTLLNISWIFSGILPCEIQPEYCLLF